MWSWCFCHQLSCTNCCQSSFNVFTLNCFHHCSSFRFWQSGQPDRGGPNNREDCVEMYHNNPVLANWNDARCGDKRRWLCEKSPSTC
uniref:C-type lectin domain-containing protein n=1 Tax=Labrus bergylta TaxID=56723 RepID=A0A3Q3E345_9LABR